MTYLARSTTHADSTELAAARPPAQPQWIDDFRRIRNTTLQLCAPLQVEDYVVQSMPDASPAKWHLAHTTWFFEQFILRPYAPDYPVFHERFDYIFNSYYQTVGPMHARAARGLLTRPTVEEIHDYRHHVDVRMMEFLESRGTDPEIRALIEIGLNHEQQHQELLLTDIKHAFSCNPLQPAYQKPGLEVQRNVVPLKFVDFAGGLRPIGATGEKFCFDNETPRHASYLHDYALANRLVTNGEFLEFVRDGGYRTAQLWLADGWSVVQSQQWSHPIYWNDACEHEFTLSGELPLDPARPVSHLSFYEADAFARWRGARLPTESEWEAAAELLEIQGNLLESATLHPTAAVQNGAMLQMFGDVWEWTASGYSPYPGYRPPAGALGEYNGKFMVNQLVLRGGSCVTPRSHIRATYRNFFYPQARWQFTGLRLARGI